MRAYFKIACFGLAAITSTALCSGAAYASPPSESELCVSQVCLGMNVGNLAKLPLEPAGMMRVFFKKGAGESFGLNAKGERISIGSSELDRQTATQLADQVKLVCKAYSLNAKMKSSDGQLIQILVSPAIVEGKGQFIVSRITRHFPSSLSQNELKKVESQARERYGNYYGEYNEASPKPNANILTGPSGGSYLVLRLPAQNPNLMEQNGCSEKSRLD